jgi:hypothetical protein
VVTKPIKQLKNSLTEAQKSAQSALETVPVGAFPNNFPALMLGNKLTLKKRAKISPSNIAIIGSFNLDAEREQSQEIGRRIMSSLGSSVFRDVDIVAVRALEPSEPGHSHLREDASIAPTAKILAGVTPGLVQLAITPINGDKLKPNDLNGYLPWVENSVTETRFRRAPSLGLIAVVGPNRLHEDFGANPLDMRDGGVLVPAGEGWRQLTPGNQYGLLRNGL